MKLWKRMGAAALAGALALNMVACGGGNAATSDTSTAASSSGAAAATGSNVLNVMTEVEVVSLDPQLSHRRHQLRGNCRLYRRPDADGCGRSARSRHCRKLRGE